ncbi:MAG TPA: hypothetical protein VKL99_15805 [Candidatus Angelobacter sp.]|nr:hypothetical protein [Candidatus Angelobacter sp.]
MQAQNVKEYKAIREELAKVRSCITSYVSFVVLGSAPAFGFLASTLSKDSSYLAMGFASGLLGLVTALVLFLLSYKFTSCNRYAGYTKLLAHESFKSEQLSDKAIFLWEICVDRLRATDCYEGEWKTRLKYCEANRHYIPDIEDLASLVAPYSGPSPSKDRKAWLYVLWLPISWKRENSWQLPLYLARIFGTIILAFLVFGIMFLVRSVKTSHLSHLHVEHIALICLFVAVILLWLTFVAKLYRQLRGSETVEAFCRKFLPIRLELLRDLKAKDEEKDPQKPRDGFFYRLVGTTVLPEDKTLGAGAGKK